MTITPEWTTGRVPLIDPDTGRFPDSYAPTPVVEALEEIGAIRSDMLARHANLSDVPDAAAARTNLGAAPVSHSHGLEQVAGLTSALDAKADLVDGRIPTSQLPTQALTDAVAVADEAAMLALTVEQVQPGDLAIRADGAGTYVLRDPDPSLLGSWLHLTAPTDAVTSVNGQVGTVVLGAADVGAVTPTQLGEAIEQVEITAEGWASAASGSATAAAGSATAAASDRGAAQTARTGAETARTGAETAKTAAEGARDATEAAVTTGLTWSGAVDLTTLAAAPRLLHATLTGSVTLTLPTPAAGRAYTVTLILTTGVAGVGVTVRGGRTSWSAAYVHTGTVGARDLVHLLWTGVEWVVLPGAPNLGVPTGWAV